ncbi:MAG: SAP domain-containing protein [Syntrophobacter sp.]
MKMQEIRTIAKKLGINSFGKSKRDLVREIQLKEGNFDCYERSDGFCDQSECLFRGSCLSEKNT